MKNNQGKTVLALGLIVVLIVFIFNSGILTQGGCLGDVIDYGDSKGNGDQEMDFKSCDSDSDCVIVKEDCCGCQMGGESTAINKKYEEEWNEENLSDCEDVVCPAVYKCPEGMAAECVNGSCEVVS